MGDDLSENNEPFLPDVYIVEPSLPAEVEFKLQRGLCCISRGSGIPLYCFLKWNPIEQIVVTIMDIFIFFWKMSKTTYA